MTKIGDKYHFLSGEMVHVLDVQPKLVARVNASEYCIEGNVDDFEAMLASGAAEKVDDDQYREGVDAFWRKRHDEAASRKEWLDKK